MKKIAIYARVSTHSQTVENQLQELHAVAQRQGWVVAAVCTDEGISGAKGRDRLPGYDASCIATGHCYKAAVNFASGLR